MKSACIIVFVASILLLPAVAPAQISGTAGLSGFIHPAGASVTLLSGSGQKTMLTTASDGRYDFGSLPEGKYVLQASAPGYAGDEVDVRLSRERHAVQNMRLLFISPIDGVDWSKGIIRAKGRGMYPSDAPNRPSAREMAKRAALSDAERNLLRIVEQIKLGPNQELISLPARSYLVRIHGYLQGFRVVSERETNDGVEVELELPLTGQSGLARYISD
jgi:carboxypeptidase family protein